MNIRMLVAALALSLVAFSWSGAQEGSPKKLVIVAGKPSHPPRMHEFNAGVQLLGKCLRDFPGLKTEIVLNGWPQDEKVFEGASAVIFYMDGGKGHEAVQEGERRLTLIDGWTKQGVGIGCMHYGVEVLADQAGEEFKRWIGGHYDHMFSCNPIWEPTFATFLDHPITRGVKPFSMQDGGTSAAVHRRRAGQSAAEVAGTKFTPISSPRLPTCPQRAARLSQRPYRTSRLMTPGHDVAVERADGGRGFGFTGGHFHDNWGNDNFRKVVLNAMVWLAKVEVPTAGVESSVSKADLDANLDPKPMPKAKAKAK
jgi:hypothetical protein